MRKKLVSVEPLPEFRLRLVFEGGESRIFDVAPYLGIGIFKELKNEQLFKTVRVSFDTVCWANDADICPDELRMTSIAEDVAEYGPGTKSPN